MNNTRVASSKNRTVVGGNLPPANAKGTFLSAKAANLLARFTPLLNLDKKRVGDISADNRVLAIRIKGCLTFVTANPDGTLNTAHKWAPQGA